LKLVEFDRTSDLNSELRRRQRYVVPRHQRHVPVSEQVFLPGYERVGKSARLDRVALQRRDEVEQFVVLHVGVLEAEIEASVQIARKLGAGRNDLGRAVAHRAVNVGGDSEGQAVGRKEVEVKVGPGDVEGVEDVSARSGVVDVFEFLRLKARVRVQAVVRVHQRSHPELVLEVLDIGAPGGFDFRHLPLQVEIRLLQLGILLHKL